MDVHKRFNDLIKKASTSSQSGGNAHFEIAQIFVHLYMALFFIFGKKRQKQKLTQRLS